MSQSITRVWRPSTARRVILDGFAPVPRGSSLSNPPLLSWPAKDPADVLDYEFDITAALAGHESDAVAAVSVVPSPAGSGLALAAWMPAWEQPVSRGIARPLPQLSCDTTALRVAHEMVRVDGRQAYVIAMNGTVPAPLLRLREGQTVKITVDIALEEDIRPGKNIVTALG